MKKLRKALLCVVLLLASAAGMPMLQDEVEELMQAMNQPKVAHTLQDERWNDAPATPERPLDSSQ